MTTTNRHSASFNDLTTFLRELVLLEDANYESVRQLWNGKVKTQPAAIARVGNCFCTAVGSSNG